MLCIGLIARAVNIALGAEVIIVAAKVIEDIPNWEMHLIELLLVLVSQMLLSGIVSLTSGVSKHNLFTTLNNKYADKVLDADYEMFTKFSCSRIITASEQIWKISSTGGVVTDIILNVVTVVVMLVEIWRLAPTMIVPVIIIYGIGLIIMKVMFGFYYKLDNESDEIKRKRNQEIDEVINGFAEVRSFCTQQKHKSSIHYMNREIVTGRRKRAYVNVGLNAVINIIDGIGVVSILLYSIIAITSGTLTVATAMALLTFTWRMIDPLISLLNNMDELSMNMSQLDEYDKVVSYENWEPFNARTECTTLDVFESKIKFKNVTFGYDKSSNVLEGLDMVIPKGKKIGICGTSGGGKTTIMKLLMKYYVPQDGSISIDGIDYRKLTTESIRDKIGIVHQDNHIFGASIWDNIIYGSWGCSESDVCEACKRANIYDFIQSLPEKFDTKVGPRGLKLSGGQKQRIALARLFLRKPEIILLDEATSALDNDSERLIQEAMEMFKGRTIITIAHRLSTIEDSDLIYVIKDHKVVEKGTHEELMRTGKEYKKLHK